MDENESIGPELTGQKLNESVFESLKGVEDLNFLERFAVFMGKAQLFEFGLSKLLTQRYRLPDDQVESWSMGRQIYELKKFKLRPDFILLAESAKDSRNDVAHSLLVSEEIGKFYVGNEFQRLSEKTLRYALFEMEQAIQVYNFLDSENLWAETE